MEVLLIDDSEVICNLYNDMLSSRGDSVTTVNDGRGGLGLVSKNEYDLILLDMCMPGFSGMDFLEELKNKKPSELKKVVVVSRLELDRNKTEKLKEFGINSIQEKPSDLVRLENPDPIAAK